MSAYSDLVLADGATSYWRLGESSGNPQDSAGANHVTVVNGTPTYSAASLLTGDANTAITFNGTDARFSVPDNTALDLGDVFSIEFLLLQADWSRVFLNKGTGAYLLLVNSGELSFLASGTATIAHASALVNDSVRHHCVITKNGSATLIYVDGADVTVADTPTTLTDTGTALFIGGDGGADFLNGRLDELAFYKNVVLTPAQVTTHYNGVLGIFGPVWVSPADTVSMTSTPVLVFTSPVSAVPEHFNLQLDTANTFNTGNLRDLETHSSQTGWEYWDDAAWQALPGTGMPAAKTGNDVRYTVTSALTSTTWYRRVRAGA